MPWEQESEFTKRDKAARVIQKAWKRFLNVTVFQHFKRLIDLRRRGEPRQIVRYINPKEVKFPPDIYYKIFTHRPIEDLCANSPRDYTKLPAKYTSHVKSDNLQEEDHRGWYRRIENNGWRLVSDTFWVSPENVEVGDKKESEFHFSKLKRRQDMEKKRKIRKIEWMRKMYYTGSLEARSTNAKTLGLIHTATKGLMRAVEIGGIDSVMEWEVDEVLNWTNTLNFDEYIANWKEIATSNSSANFKKPPPRSKHLHPLQASPNSLQTGFPLEQARKRGYDYADISEEKLGIPEDTLDGSFYEKPNFPRLSPDLTYGV
ncbi:protein MFI isoform X2 [Leopardus geoffroyi]|uniref:protein MFI isoform X2 n=1 Tax=Leopardus geoffroyi TaxID=46844 RepID=UPI001E2637D3|nr:protein MFI isoform X2 [Leopardus geoffroyi]